MPNGTYGGVRGRKTKVGRKLSFSSYSICGKVDPDDILSLLLVVFKVNFEICLRMIAYRADFGSFSSHYDMSAVAAFPYLNF